MTRWILVRHGAHADGRLTAHGEAQVDRLRDALERRRVVPTLYLRSGLPQAEHTYFRLAERLNARAVITPALTPRQEPAGLDALARLASAELERAATVILIGHEGRLSNLLTELTSTRWRPFPEAGAVCVTADSVHDLLPGRGQVCLDRVFPRVKEKTMARPPMFSVAEKQRIVLSVLRGECSVAEAARRNRCSETSIAKWREQFVQAGVAALEAGAARGPSAREAQLERELAEVTSALGEAHVRLRLAERERAGFASRSWR